MRLWAGGLGLTVGVLFPQWPKACAEFEPSPTGTKIAVDAFTSW